MKAQDEMNARLDDLQRILTSLLTHEGLKPVRAAVLARHGLWFEMAGLPNHGLASVLSIADALGRRDLDPISEGKIRQERGATAVFDGQNGPPPLVMARASELAVEKAREFGAGIVSVRGIGKTGPATPIVAEAASGPMIGAAWGPDGAWSLAIPRASGLPLLSDSAFGSSASPAAVPWSALSLEGEWVVQAVSVKAMGSLESLHVRAARAEAMGSGARFSPEDLETRRREAFERGVKIDPARLEDLRERAARLGLSFHV